MCICVLLRGCFHVVEIGRVPSTKIIWSVSATTTADSVVSTSRLEHYLLVVIFFRFGLYAMRNRAIFRLVFFIPD